MSMYNFYHTQDKKWLQKEIASCKTPALVITHHAPLSRGVSHPKFETIPPPSTNHAYCTDLSDVVESLPNGSHWVYGHTHHRTQFNHKHVTISSNSRGYNTDTFTQPFSLQYFNM
jgi:hypothetical protein